MITHTHTHAHTHTKNVLMSQIFTKIFQYFIGYSYHVWWFPCKNLLWKKFLIQCVNRGSLQKYVCLGEGLQWGGGGNHPPCSPLIIAHWSQTKCLWHTLMCQMLCLMCNVSNNVCAIVCHECKNVSNNVQCIECIISRSWRVVFNLLGIGWVKHIPCIPSEVLSQNRI